MPFYSHTVNMIIKEFSLYCFQSQIISLHFGTWNPKKTDELGFFLQNMLICNKTQKKKKNNKIQSKSIKPKITLSKPRVFCSPVKGLLGENSDLGFYNRSSIADIFEINNSSRESVEGFSNADGQIEKGTRGGWRWSERTGNCAVKQKGEWREGSCHLRASPRS